ncbi:MAG: glycosyltransferase [Prevotella sp.]|jgi:glycosyltransferase involved in cell wall biosynthesis|nr:glycosyltransferase [Prevotella sp.]
MNILNIATTDSGGAGKASVAINSILKNGGYNSKLIVRYKATQDANIISIHSNFSDIIYRQFLKIISKITEGNKIKEYYFFAHLNLRSFNAINILKKSGFIPDVIMLHWIAQFIDIKTIRKLYELTGVQIYWLMMDNAPLTGGCHYPWECKGFYCDCKDCPGVYYNKKGIYRYFQKKRKYLDGIVNFISFSQTDFDRLKKAAVLKHNEAFHLLGPVDENDFCPAKNRRDIKNTLGLKGEKVIFAGAIDLTEQRKGLSYLVEALSILEEKYKIDNIILLLASTKIDGLKINIPIKFLGYLNESSLIKVYQAADVFLCTSIEDSGPLMINQSISCGTPVVSFNVGVAPDLVQEDITGYRAKLKDADELAYGLYKVLTMKTDDYETMRKNCRQLAMDKLSKEVFLRDIHTIISKKVVKCKSNDYV